MKEQQHPLINEDSPHYRICGGEAITYMERIFTVDELKAWAKLTAFKYSLRVGSKDVLGDMNKSIISDVKKKQTYQDYYHYLCSNETTDVCEATPTNKPEDTPTTEHEVTRQKTINFLTKVKAVVLEKRLENEGTYANDSYLMFLRDTADVIDIIIADMEKNIDVTYEAHDFWYGDTHFILDEVYYISSLYSDQHVTVEYDGEYFYNKYYKL